MAVVEYYRDTLGIKSKYLVELGCCSYSNYKQLVVRGKITLLRRSCRNTSALAEFETLPYDYKLKVRNKLGNPYELVEVISFEDYIHEDQEAWEFFSSRTLENGEHLPTEARKQYYLETKMIKGLIELSSNWKALQRTIGGGTVKIWERLSKMIQLLDHEKYPHSLPVNPRSLRRKCDRYTKEGYESLIHKRYGKSFNEKVTAEVKMWLLAKWSNNVDRMTSMEHLLQVYNEYALANRLKSVSAAKGWNEIKSVNTIANFLNKPEIKALWVPCRQGELHAKEKFIYQHKTALPSMRDSLWYSDGTKMNFYYLDSQGKISTESVYEIVDTFSEVLLGCSFGQENFEHQKKAYKMALNFSGHKPYQVTFDNQGGHNKGIAGSFFNNLAHLAIKTKPYNGKSKTIENIFYRFQHQFMKRKFYFSGQNITTNTDESKANMEMILANKENLPTYAEVKAEYLKLRNEWNNAKHPHSEQSRLQMYKESVNPKTRAISSNDMMEIFGVKHPNPVRVTAYGILFERNKIKYNFDVKDPEGLPDVKWISDHIDAKYICKYDPDDMTTISLYKETAKGLVYIAEASTHIEIHRGKQEQESWEASFYKNIESKSKQLRIDNRDKIDDILKAHGLLPEQNGLNSVPLKGIETSSSIKKSDKMQQKRLVKAKTKGIAMYQKELSNAVEIDDSESLDKILDNVLDKSVKMSIDAKRSVLSKF